jgi:hemerythrin superfamily protein
MENIGSDEEIVIIASEEVFTEGDDVVAFLKAQHDTIKMLFEAVLESTGEDRERIFYQLRRLLAVHETAEEQVVHPAARRALDSGDEIVGRRLHEENEAKKALAAIEKLDLHSMEFEDALSELEENVLAHAESEENEEFDELALELDEDRLVTMRKLFTLAESIAPTRPHAGVESATANTLVGPFASIIDRVRDLVTGKR